MNLLILILATFISSQTLIVKSTAFANNNYIPLKYTCDGPNVNPALVIEDIPKSSKSLVLIMDDTDSPNGEFIDLNLLKFAIGTDNSGFMILNYFSSDITKLLFTCPICGIRES